MDSGLIFTLGVAFGLLGGVGFILLLIGTDDYATAYFSAQARRLGASWAAINPEAKQTVNSKENVSQESSLDSGERPGASGSAPGILALLLAVLLVGCAHGGVGGHVSPSVGGGVAGVHSQSRPGETGRTDTPQLATSPRTEDLPVCGMEDPYLPDPCRIEITKGEWLRVSNAGPKKSQKHHSKWWWLLITLITF